MEFLDINLTKYLSLLLMLFTVPSTSVFFIEWNVNKSASRLYV
jgi:hypothetical protein